MADNDELEYYDDDDIRDQIPDDDGQDEGGGERSAPPTPVRPLQTSSRQPAARPPARPPRPLPRQPQGGPPPETGAQSSSPPPRRARPTPASSSPPPQDWPAASESEYQPRIVHSRPGEPLRDLSPPPPAPTPDADTPGRLARLLRRSRRQDSQPGAQRPDRLQALRARLPDIGVPDLLGDLAQRAGGAWRLPLPGRREQEPARQGGGARRRRRNNSKAPRLGGSGLTLDNKLDILGVLLVLASLALFLSSLSTIRGQLTQVVNTFLGNSFGWGALAVPLLFFAIGAWLIVRHFGSEAPVVNPLRVAGGALFFVGLLLFFQFVDSFNPSYSSIDLSDPVRLRLQLELSWNAGRGGGYAGAELYYLLVTGLGEVGMLVSTTGLLLIGAMFALQISVADLAALASRGWRRLKKARERRARQREERRQAARAAILQARATGAVAADDEPRSIPITMGGRTVKAVVSEQQSDASAWSGLRALASRLRAGTAALSALRGANEPARLPDNPPSPAPAADLETMAAPQEGLPASAPAGPAPPLHEGFPAAPPERPTAGAVTAPTEEEEEAPPQVLPPAASQQPLAAEAPSSATVEERSPRIPPSPTSMRPTLAAAPRRRPRDWQLPDLRSLLNVGSESDLDREILLGRARTIEETLQSFGSPGRVVEVNTGPVITQFGVEPDYLLTRAGKKTRVKVGAIAQLDKDLQLALGAKTIRIEAPVPGKGYVGIEVPNAQAAVVSLRDVMESEPFRELQEGAALAIGLGQSVDGTPVAADLASMPHLLIAGTTGSGKSVLVNAIIVSLLVNNTPDRLRFIMVDPKRVELTSYNGVPHLVAPVVVDLERTLGVLKWVTREMDERYRRFSEAGARNIEDYNRHLNSDQERMPYIVVVIDELADLMMLAPDETERVITRIAALARATGIHLVIATQRPSVDVVTGLIKANFPARIAFAVAGGVDSRVILDQPGAERLLGKGDMLYLSGSAPAAARLQGVLVSPEEVDNITGYWKRQALDEPGATPLPDVDAGDDDAPADSPPADMPPLPSPSPDAEARAAASQQAHLAFPDFSAWEEEKGIELHERVSDERDELYEQAVEMVRRLNKASVSLLQRRMRIGYTRAARLIDMMEDQGVIGPAQDGSKPREVLPE